MGGKNTIAIGLIGIGMIGIYLGAAGHLQSFWTGLTGGYGDSSDTGSDGKTSPPIEPQNPDAVEGKGGFGPPSSPQGVFYPLPTGVMASSSSGLF